MARTLRAETKLDPKQRLQGALYSAQRAALEVAGRHAEAIQKLANVKLRIRRPERRPRRRRMRSTAEFDLVLRGAQVAGRSAGQARRQGARAARKEHRQFQSASSPTKCSSARRRRKWSESIRAKLADYEDAARQVVMNRTIPCASRLEEDIGSGDVTTHRLRARSQQARGRFLAREPLIVAGLGAARRTVRFRHASQARWRPLRTMAKPSPKCAGAARTLLERERVALNFLQRLSGVATLARQFADAVAGTGCRVLDTRKTTPGLRAVGKSRCRRRRRHQSSHGPLRRRAHQEQPHRRRRRSAHGHRARTRERPAHRDRSAHARRARRSARRRRGAPAARQSDARRSRRVGPRNRRPRRAWNSPAASLSRTSARTPKPAPISSPPAPSPIRRAPWTSASAWSCR